MSEHKWYKTTWRWCQTNLTEIDAKDCDIEFWKKYWEENQIQGIIVNAGGIVAYYPSKYPLQYRSKYLQDGDLVKVFTEAARERGIRVLARMDINRATGEFVKAHPEWFAVDKEGRYYEAGERYLTCINSAYYKEYVPMVLEEIIEKYHPDGITDNSWQGPGAGQICYCENCRKKFKEDTGLDLPEAPDWNDKTYKVWIKWSFKSRTDNWDLFNNITEKYGGEDCLWLGMVNANPIDSHCALYDIREIGERSKIIMTDHQSRDTMNGLEQNSLNGMLLHAISGWDTVIPESMANYVRGVQTFRRASNPKLETQKWIQEGIAGGISPWVHYVGGKQEDRRQYENCREIMRWHKEQEKYLYDRVPISGVGLVWSQENVNFYGKDNRHVLCAQPWRGFTRALTRARIPAVPVHAAQISRHAQELSVLILPDLAVMTDGQIEDVKAFVKQGGSVVYTGASGMLDEWGEPRKRFPLDEMFGIRRKTTEIITERQEAATKDWEQFALHNYLRLHNPEHPILQGFENTDILPFGGEIYEAESERLTIVATLIPAFPIYPPEISFMEPDKRDSGVPVILAGDTGYGGRVVCFLGDIDRRYCQYNMGDHGDLLAQAVHYALQGREVLEVEGKGYLDCRLYRQKERLILHMINLSGANQFPGLLEEEYEVGPFRVRVRTENCHGTSAVLKCRGEAVPVSYENGWAVFMVNQISSQELVVIGEESAEIKRHFQ